MPVPVLGRALGQNASLPSADRPGTLPALSAEESAEYGAWESIHRTFFLMAYQWLSTAAASGLERLDGAPFTGVFAEGIDAANEALKVAGKYARELPEKALGDFGSATEALKEAVDRTVPAVRRAIEKYRPLRDRVAAELVSAGESVAYEVVGDDPQAPGTVFERRLGPPGVLDVSAVYSGHSDDRMVREALDMEGSFESLGVPFRKSDLSGANLGAGKMPILAHLITLVAGIVTFFYLYKKAAVTGELHQAAIGMVKADETLTADQKADLISKIIRADSFFGSLFGPTFNWTALVAAALVLGLAFWAVPKILKDRPWEKRRGALEYAR